MRLMSIYVCSATARQAGTSSINCCYFILKESLRAEQKLLKDKLTLELKHETAVIKKNVGEIEKKIEAVCQEIVSVRTSLQAHCFECCHWQLEIKNLQTMCLGLQERQAELLTMFRESAKKQVNLEHFVQGKYGVMHRVFKSLIHPLVILTCEFIVFYLFI